MWKLTHLKRPWCWERMKVGGEGDDRGWDSWMASPTQWTWVGVNSGSWWWTGKPSMLQSMGSQSQKRLCNWTDTPCISVSSTTKWSISQAKKHSPIPDFSQSLTNSIIKYNLYQSTTLHFHHHHLLFWSHYYEVVSLFLLLIQSNLYTAEKMTLKYK